MRSVDELPHLGFQDFGGTWSRQEYDIQLTEGRAGFSLQLGVYTQGPDWDRIDVYVGHPSYPEHLWWTFDLQGNVTDAGGDHDALLTAFAGGPEAAEELFAGHGTAHTYDTLKQKAVEAVHAVISQLHR